MNKILLAFDGTNFSKGAFEFARRLNELQPVLLIGSFLPQTDFSASWSYSTGEGPLPIPTLEPSVSEKVAENMLRFEALCKSNAIDFKTHEHFYQLATPELLKETRYADLLVLGSEKFFRGDMTYLTDILHETECPVLVVPEECPFPERLVLAYDGSRESVFAIKQFSCLFPELCGLPTTLVYVCTASDRNKSIPDEPYIRELAARHYSDLDIRRLELDSKNEFNAWLSGIPAPLLISGSFSRSFFAQIFRESFTQKVVGSYLIPVFIAHK